MKHFNTFLTVLLILFLGSTQSVKAQDSKIDWSPYARNYASVVDQYVYLYNKTHDTFVNAGGSYGMQAVLNSRGIRLTLREKSGYFRTYYFEGPIVNSAQGSCIALMDDNTGRIFIDRPEPNTSTDYAAIKFEQTETNTYRIVNNNSYYRYDTSTGCVMADGTSRNADEWYLITAADYRQAIKDASAQGRYNISGLLLNSRFIRNVSDVNNPFWSTTGLNYTNSDYCTSIDPHMGTTGSNDGYASNYGAFGCLEIGNATGTFYQTVSGLTPGLYAVSAQAFFDINDASPYTGGAYN